MMTQITENVPDPVSKTGTTLQTFPRFSVRETRKSTIVAFLAWTVAVYDYILFGTMLPRIREDFGWSSSQALLISTFVSIGTAVVVLGVGPLVDKLGRRKGMMFTVGGTALSSVATAASGGALSLVLTKSIGGLGLSEQAVNATYLNEIYDVSESEKVRRNRGFIYSLVQSGWPIGALLAAGFVAVVGSLFGPENWRIAFLIATIPAAVIAVICSRLEESPQFELQDRIRRLQKSGKNDEADVLARAYGLDVHRSSSFKRIFDSSNRRNTIVLSLVWTMNWFGIQVFSVLGTTVLEEAKGFSSNSTLVLVVLANAVGALGYLFCGWAGDRFGRRNTIIVSWTISALLFVVLLLGPSTAGFVLPVYMFALFFLMGPYAALNFFMAECYPTDCRATGATFIGAMSQPGAIIGGFLLTWLVAINIGFGSAALFVGCIGILASGLLMLGTRKIAAKA
ncbi:MFS transporter [Rhodococcus sp. T2V]|uniref:MFS transporter n=1 Tax=Rhodococcus sp. T2V TaxID=3034164 RepID=UPI0023E11C97|nr:MFS transporter [Rhodococcus sp. T2V]MDF3308144.1 MFS transporter [Rhodococcus sp. T2V]